MKVGLVRKLDFWLGIPLCFFLTVVNFLIWPFRGKPSNSPKKFLFIELSEMGSAVLAYSAMKYLNTKYPGAEIFFAIFEKNRASVDAMGLIRQENILTISERSLFKFVKDFAGCVWRLWRAKIDVAFDLELFARSTVALTFLSGAPLRVGFFKYHMEGLYRGNLLTHKIPYNFQQHISKSFLVFIKALERQPKNFPALDVLVSDSEIETPKYLLSEHNKTNIWQKLKARFTGQINAFWALNRQANLFV